MLAISRLDLETAGAACQTGCMVERDLTSRLKSVAASFPAVTLTGPRQSGKTTLCRALFPRHAYVSLEAPDTRAFARDDPRAFLAQYAHGAIIDEVQRCPDLPSYLQELIDANPVPGRWILTGSQNLSLLSSVSQSLAGRTAVLHLLPLSRNEVTQFEHHPRTLDDTLFTGGYPRILDQRLAPADWLSAYVGSYIERDVRNVSNVGDLAIFQRFVSLCAGRTAQLLNLSALAADCGIAQPTAKAWMSLLEIAFIAFRLPAYSGNLRKRLVRMPKLHFYDTGLVCWLLGIRTPGQLRTHPLRGAIFETWVASEILKHRTHRGESRGLFHYRDRQGAEVDMLVENSDGLTLVEAKAGATPSGDMLDAVQHVSATLGVTHPSRGLAVYGGTMRQSRGNMALIPWSGIQAEKWMEVRGDGPYVDRDGHAPESPPAAVHEKRAIYRTKRPVARRGMGANERRRA